MTIIYILLTIIAAITFQKTISVIIQKMSSVFIKKHKHIVLVLMISLIVFFVVAVLVESLLHSSYICVISTIISGNVIIGLFVDFYVRTLNRRIMNAVLRNAEVYINYNKKCNFCGETPLKVSLKWDYSLTDTVNSDKEMLDTALIINGVCCDNEKEFVKHMVEQSMKEIAILNFDLKH